MTSKRVASTGMGRHQVAGQRRLDGDLQLLDVGISDHDLVRVVAQDRAQAAGRRSPSFVDRNLDDALELILDRVFDRDDFSSPALSSDSAAYKVVVLPLPVGPVIKTMP